VNLSFAIVETIICSKVIKPCFEATHRRNKMVEIERYIDIIISIFRQKSCCYYGRMVFKKLNNLEALSLMELYCILSNFYFLDNVTLEAHCKAF